MPKQNDRTPTPAVLAVSQMAFEGHIVPHTWYDHVTYTTDGGVEKVDLQAIIILSDIVYWYRPKRVMDEATGKILRLERRFTADKLQRNYQQIADQFGLSKNQASRAVKRLRDLGLITMEFRVVETDKGNIPNVLFLEPVTERLAEITYPRAESVRVSSQICEDTLTNLSTYPHKNVRTYTENTSENTPTDKKIPPAQDESGKHKPDILDAMVRFQGIPSESWTVPAAAGGADDWQPAVDAFASLVGLDPAAVPKGTRKEWSRQLQEVGREWRGGPKLLAEVIEQVPESQFHWKTYSSPHGAKADLGVLIGQHRNGGIRKQESSSNGSAVGQIAAIRKKMAQQQSRDAPVDAEFRVMKGEVL